MSQVRRVVLGFNHFTGLSECCQGIAVLTGNSCIGLVQTLAVKLHQAGAVDLRVFAAVPFNGHIAQGFFGTPPVVSHHSDKLTHVQHFDDAAAVVDFAAVNRNGLAAKHRRL